MTWFECPYLGVPVELTDERWAHIRKRHRYFGPEDTDVLAAVLAHPDEIRQRASDPNELLFVQASSDRSRPLCVVVTRIDDARRWWIATAYITDVSIGAGDVIWRDDVA